MLDIDGIAAAVEEESVVLGDLDLADTAEVLGAHILQLDLDALCAKHGAAGHDGHVLQRALAVVTKAGCLHGNHLQVRAQAVDHQRAQRLVVNILRDDQQGPVRVVRRRLGWL
jgi:hypothetical protein